MQDLLDMFEIQAMSKDGQQYRVELSADPDKVSQAFDTHMSNIGWSQYDYKITAYRKVESKHIEIEDDTING